MASFPNPNVFSKLPLDWPLKERVRLGLLRTIAGLSARCAERVMFVSEDSAHWIGDALGLPVSRRAPIPHGIDTSLWSKAPDTPLHPNPYILSVSSIYRYKNYVRLIEAYAEIAKRQREMPDLLIIGDDQDPDYLKEMYAARDAAASFAENIHILGEVPYAEIQRYYAGASFFVFPSYLETFGIPMLEAMVSGLPTVAADIPIFREIGGDAALYADPHSTPALAKAMEQVIFTPGVAELLAERGHERVMNYNLERTVARLLSLFNEICA
ncbi:MAG: glycosyltransferase family 1 protein [Myxococcota bacterium]|nr:glycosyltransferase family 4 protein [bacterium]MDP7431605.1 glycosyltransferase family 1 protein [Myxococcota bacterium]